MNLALALFLLPSATPSGSASHDLRFESGNLARWEGNGFYVTTAAGSGPSLRSGVCSSDRGSTGHTGLLHRTFVVPPGTGAIRFTAAAVRPSGVGPGPRLDIVLEAARRQILPKQVRTAQGLQPVETILPSLKGKPQEYVWDVSNFAGQTVRIALWDEDDRPGCYLRCTGFHFIPREESQGREFAEQMVRLSREHHLPPITRFDSKHFMALSNAQDDFSEHRLYNCETIYDLFFQHFRRRGFPVKEPKGKMMVAIFDSQAGFEAYLNGPMSTAITGIYHRPSNRLVVYDYGQNRAFVAGKERVEQMARQFPLGPDRQRVSVRRQALDRRDDTNIGTIMHEVAHQLSFNSGLLNRDGDVAVWLAEGLACYCEATDHGAWQGPGEPNPLRAASLAVQLRGKGGLIPLRALVTSDDWLRKAENVNLVLLGYAQSWALFRMLMDERPRDLRKFLALIHPRRAPDHRLTDFAEAFGSDLARMESRYQEYVRDLVSRETRPPR